MPDVLEAPLLAKTLGGGGGVAVDDGYGAASGSAVVTAAAVRGLHHQYFRLQPSPWWTASLMSGGVEVTTTPYSRRTGSSGGQGGLRLVTPYTADTGTTSEGSAASGASTEHQRSGNSRYCPQDTRVGADNTPHSGSGGDSQLHRSNSTDKSLPHSHHHRQHLSNLENLTHRHRYVPLHLLHRPHGGASGGSSSKTGGRCVPLSSSNTSSMRANERWVLLNKETFQEIFDATLHEMTYAPGELVDDEDDPIGRDRKSTSPASSDSPPSPTTPETLNYQPKSSYCVSRKRKLSDNERDEPVQDVGRPNFRRQASPPLAAMAPTESAKTINDLSTNDRLARHSPAISSTTSNSTSAASSAPPSPRLTSPGGYVMTSQHSPGTSSSSHHRTLAPPTSIPDNRENNEPLDLSCNRKVAQASWGRDNSGHMNSANSNNHSDNNNPRLTCTQEGASTNTSLRETVHLDRPGGAGHLRAGGESGKSYIQQEVESTGQQCVTVNSSRSGQQAASSSSNSGSSTVRADSSSSRSRVAAPDDLRAPSPRGGGGREEGVGSGCSSDNGSSSRGRSSTGSAEKSREGAAPVEEWDEEVEVDVVVDSGTEDVVSLPLSATTTTSSATGKEARDQLRGAGPANSATTSSQRSSSHPEDLSSRKSSYVSDSKTSTNTAKSGSQDGTTSTKPLTVASHPEGNTKSVGAASGVSGTTNSTTQDNSTKRHSSTRTSSSRNNTPSPVHHVAPRSPAVKTSSTTSSKPSATSQNHVMKPASENWMPLNKATVYDLVEEVMYSLGEDEEEEERARTTNHKVSHVNNNNNNALRDNSNHRKPMSQATLNLSQHQSQKTARGGGTSSTLPHSNNNNNNALKRAHSEVDGGVHLSHAGGSGSSTLHRGGNHGSVSGNNRSVAAATASSSSTLHRCSPPVPMERCGGDGGGRQQQQQHHLGEETLSNNMTLNSGSRSASNNTTTTTTPRLQRSNTKSQLRDHLSARSQQQGGSGSCTKGGGGPSSTVPASSSSNLEEKKSQQQHQNNWCSPLRPIGNMTGMGSSSTLSPTSKAKEQQCWVALNKNLVYNIVESAMRNSESEDDYEENKTGEKKENNYNDNNKSSDSSQNVEDSNAKGQSGAEQYDSNSFDNRVGDSVSKSKPTALRLPTKDSGEVSCSMFSSEGPRGMHNRKRSCSSPVPSPTGGGHTLEEAVKRSRMSPSHPSSPLRANVAEGRNSLEGLLSESCSTGRRTPTTATASRQQHHQHHYYNSPLHSMSNLPQDGSGSSSNSVSERVLGAVSASSTTTTTTPQDGPSSSKGRKSIVHLEPGQRIDQAARTAANLQHVARSHASHAPDGNHSSRPLLHHRQHQLPLNSPSSNSKNQSSASLNNVGGGLSASSHHHQQQAQRANGNDARATSPSATTGNGGNYIKHGVVPVPVSKHGLVPVSPSLTDARSSPRLGWVAVSKIDVHNIVDSVVDSMIGILTKPDEDDGDRSSPVPSSPSPSPKSPSPPQLTSVTSPLAARDAETIHRTDSPHSPTSCSSPRQPEVEKRSTPSPLLPASPGSPRSPGDALSDRCGDAKSSSSKAFKWKSSLLMRVEEEKIDVTAEVATNSTSSSGRSTPTTRVNVGNKQPNKGSKESRSLRSGKRGSRKGGSSSTGKLK